MTEGFFLRDARIVAQELLGCLFVRGRTAGRIVETEAYLSANDPASHAHRGPTKRNRVMFGPPGCAYVYFTYGMHYCVNAVCREAGVAEAVLIRALEPVRGMPLMQRRRQIREIKDLTNGPAKLVQALGVSANDNGRSLLRGTLRIVREKKLPPNKILRGPRIGVSRGRDFPYRFWIRDHPFVSR